jgi:hypothetical protein
MLRQNVSLLLAISVITAIAARIATNTGQKMDQKVDETSEKNGIDVTM